MKQFTILFFVLAGLAAEISAQPTKDLIERFDQIDRDKDGTVTSEETGSAPWFKRLLGRLDRNGDGMLQRSEVARNALRTEEETSGLQMPEERPHTKYLGIRYDEIKGVDPNLLSLDLYVPKLDAPGTGRPVLIMIHGGGWRRGDKANPPIVGAKMRHFVGSGYIYASVNYRLSPEMPNEVGIQHPIHAQDCAKAIAWIHDHIEEYGGAPDRLHLMGHSAGGHLAGIVATNDRFLKAEGKDLSILRSNVLLDPAAVDIPRFIELSAGRSMSALYELAFGKDEANWRDASPQLHVAPGKHVPPTLVFYAGGRMKLDVLAPALADALTEAGSPSQAIDTVTLDHGQINSHIGMVGEPMTRLIMRLHAGEDASTFPATLNRSSTPTATGETLITFSRDYVPGTRDANGRFMGGTETMRPVAHDGKRYTGGYDGAADNRRNHNTAWIFRGTLPVTGNDKP